MRCLALALALPTGKYCGSALMFVSIEMDFNPSGTVDADINVKIAHKDINCPGEKVSASGNTIKFSNIDNDGDCMGDALRAQKKDVDKFFLVDNGDGTITFKSAWPDMKMKQCPSALLEDDCTTLYKIKDPDCGQLCLPAKEAGLAEKFGGAVAGECASVGYTQYVKTTNLTEPVIGTFTVKEYTKPAMLLDANVTVYKVDYPSTGECGQMSVPSAQAKWPIMFGHFKQGQCSDAGYTVASGQEQECHLGHCSMCSVFKKPSEVVEAEPCCTACDAASGLEKYYSIDHMHNMCGEACMKPSQYGLYKLFEPGLTKATDAHPCQIANYGDYSQTVTHGFGPVKMTLDLYKQSAFVV